MEQCSPLGWFFYNDEEGTGTGMGIISEMRQYIVQSRMEVEATVIAAQEEMMKKEEELIQLKDLLVMTIKERDEAQSKYQKLMLKEKQTQATVSFPTTNCFSSSSIISEREESSKIISSPQIYHSMQIFARNNHRPLPEKGQLLKAVMEAGPLLQTLLLAGPLPQWQHPPPQLNSIEIPPVSVTINNYNSTSPSHSPYPSPSPSPSPSPRKYQAKGLFSI